MSDQSTDAESGPVSWLDRFLSARRLTLPLVSLGVVLLALLLAAVECSDLGRQAMQVVGACWESGPILRAAFVVGLWLLGAIVTHVLACFMGLRSPFLVALRVLGGAWLLYAAILILADAILIALVSVGWIVGAQLWHVSIGQAGALLWVLFYPTAVRIAFGSQARSCVITFLTLPVLFLMVGASAYLFFVVPA